MERLTAMTILKARGWNEDGATAILDELELDNLTEEQLTMVAEDYEDR